MNTQQTIASFFGRLMFAGLLCTAAACGGGSPTSPSAARDYTGAWSGTTAQGKAISFQVSGTTITSLTVGYLVQGRFTNSIGSGTCTADGSVTQQMSTPISANAFSFSGSTVSTLAGNFGSATSVSGSLTFTLTASSCAGTSNTTFTATKG